jgi:hypothetical protein
MSTAIPVATTCTVPAVDRDLTAMIADLAEVGLTVRQATEVTARRAAADATGRGWPRELVQFVIIRAADLGAQYAARLA